MNRGDTNDDQIGESLGGGPEIKVDDDNQSDTEHDGIRPFGPLPLNFRERAVRRDRSGPSWWALTRLWFFVVSLVTALFGYCIINFGIDSKDVASRLARWNEQVFVRAASWWGWLARTVNPPMQIRVHGATRMTHAELLAGVPAEPTLVWWWLHNSEARASVAKHPWVADVAVAPCRDVGGLRCRELLIRERIPRFLVGIDGVVSLVAEDGRVLSSLPVSEDQAALARRELEDEQLILVTGLFPARDEAGGDTERELRALARAVGVIESEVGLRVDTVKGKGSRQGAQGEANEIEVAFRSFPGVVTFTNGARGKVLIREAERLAKLLHQFGAKSHLLRSIDLSFDRLAVVTLADGNGKSSEAISGLRARPAS